MDEIKSAFDRALERAERLGRPSPEETRRSKEGEYTPIGRALAERYLGHGYVKVFTEEADRYSGEEKGMVMRAALSRLVEAMELGDREVMQRAMDGIIAFSGRENLDQIRSQIEAVFEEYRRVEGERYEMERVDVERKERELLHRLGISGSAIAEINIDASEAWQERAQELYSHYDGRLQQLKQQLLKLVASGADTGRQP
jgi:hypothetical protein